LLSLKHRWPWVRQVLADSDLEHSKTQSQILALQREVQAQTKADCGRMEAQTQAYEKQKEAEAQVEMAKRLAQGKKAQGEAEGFASAAFAAQRSHEASQRRLDILEKIVQKDDVQIATSQENTVSMNQDNAVVTQVAQQGLEALRAKLAEVTAKSLESLEKSKPAQQKM